MHWFVVSLISALMLGLHGGPAAAEKFRITTAETDQIRMLVPLIKEVYRRIGHEAEVTFLPSLRSLASSNSGKFDAELARTTTAVVEYPNLVQVPEPLFVVSASVIVQDARTRGMNATVVGKPDNIARMVMKDRVEIGILLTYDAEKFASEMSSLRVIEPPIETVALYHYVHFKHRSLVPLLKEVLIKMHKTGEVREILQRAQ